MISDHERETLREVGRRPPSKDPKFALSFDAHAVALARAPRDEHPQEAVKVALDYGTSE
jgi:hypothetical protein